MRSIHLMNDKLLLGRTNEQCDQFAGSSVGVSRNTVKRKRGSERDNWREVGGTCDHFWLFGLLPPLRVFGWWVSHLLNTSNLKALVVKCLQCSLVKEIERFLLRVGVCGRSRAVVPGGGWLLTREASRWAAMQYCAKIFYFWKSTPWRMFLCEIVKFCDVHVQMCCGWWKEFKCWENSGWIFACRLVTSRFLWILSLFQLEILLLLYLSAI